MRKLEIRWRLKRHGKTFHKAILCQVPHSSSVIREKFLFITINIFRKNTLNISRRFNIQGTFISWVWQRNTFSHVYISLWNPNASIYAVFIDQNLNTVWVCLRCEMMVSSERYLARRQPREFYAVTLSPGDDISVRQLFGFKGSWSR